MLSRSNQLPWIVILICLITAIGYPFLGSSRTKQRMSAGLSYLKQSGVALHMYASDYDDRLPVAGEWMAGVQPYSPSIELFTNPDDPRCRGVKDERHPERGNYGMAFMSVLSRVNLNTLQNADSRIMLFESHLLAWNAFGDLESVRFSQSEPPFTKVARADSSAKVYRLEDFKGFDVRTGVWTRRL